jgi:hypothetical protein
MVPAADARGKSPVRQTLAPLCGNAAKTTAPQRFMHFTVC